jgi:hypothetical protein
MHPDLLGQVVQMEHTRRLQAAEAAALRHTDLDAEGAPIRRPGRTARLLGFWPHRRRSPIGPEAAQLS